MLNNILFCLEKRKTWFESYKGISDDEDEVDQKITADKTIDHKLKVCYQNKLNDFKRINFTCKLYVIERRGRTK